MLADVLIRKATRRDVRQLALKELPELIIQVIPNIVFPVVCLIFLWIKPVNLIMQIIVSFPLLIWAALFIVVLLYVLGQLLGFISPHSKCSTQWVAIYGKKVIAEATLDTHEHYSHLRQLSVRQQFQRQGVGSLLVNHLSQQSFAPVYVQAEKKLLSFYFRLGFRLASEDELPEDLKQIFSSIHNAHKDKYIQDLVSI